MIQTPTRQKNIQEFASPIGLLRKYSSTQTPTGQVSNLKNNSYEDEFFKIKSQRLETELQEAKQENSILRAKVADSAANLQILKEKILTLESNNIQAPSNIQTERYKSGAGGEVQKLLKQIRILKNQHEIEMVKLQDENRKLKRKILEITTKPNEKNDVEEDEQREQMKRNQQQAYFRVLEQNEALREDIKKEAQRKQEFEEKLYRSQSEKTQLSKQIQQLQTMLSAKNRYQEKYNNLLTKYEQQSNQMQALLQEKRQNLEGNSSYEGHSSSPLRKTILNKENSPVRFQQESKSLDGNSRELQNRVKLLEIKIQQQNNQLSEKELQIKNILEKLKPLLSRDDTSSKRESGVERASFSMLQIFLKKYKIASF